MLPEDDPRHGTYAGTVAHWKNGTPPCEPCRTAGRKTDKLIRHDRHNGNPRTGPLGKRAWNVVHTAPRDQLSRATGLRVDKIIRLDGRGPDAIVLRTTRDRILAAERLDFWTAIGVQRRLRALTARGWSMRALAAETGLNVDCLKRCRIRETPQFARREFALPVIEAYDRLHMTNPQGRGATRARNEAVANGWAPPLAFDNIDDPNEQPKGTVSAGVYWADECDPVTVQRWFEGDRNIRTTRAEKEAITAEWVRRGGSVASLGRVMGWRAERYTGSAA